MNRDRDNLMISNENLKAEIPLYFVDPYANHKSSDAQIEAQYRHLHAIVAQTARKVLELQGYGTQSLQRNEEDTS